MTTKSGILPEGRARQDGGGETHQDGGAVGAGLAFDGQPLKQEV